VERLNNNPMSSENRCWKRLERLVAESPPWLKNADRD